MFKEGKSSHLTMTAIFVVVGVCIFTLPLLFRLPKLPISVTTGLNNLQEPNERYIVALWVLFAVLRFEGLLTRRSGYSYTRSGFTMNWTYTKTGLKIDDIDRHNSPTGELSEGPNANNLIGNLKLLGIMSLGGRNWVINIYSYRV